MAPHGLLAGMFGRQPAPHIFHVWGCRGGTTPADWGNLITLTPKSTPFGSLQVTIRNHGVTVVRSVYVNYWIAVPGPNCRAEMSDRDPAFRFSELFGVWHLISNDQYWLPPAAMVAPFTLDLYLKPPFESPLRYELSFGCEGSPVHRIVT